MFPSRLVCTIYVLLLARESDFSKAFYAGPVSRSTSVLPPARSTSIRCSRWRSKVGSLSMQKGFASGGGATQASPKKKKKNDKKSNSSKFTAPAKTDGFRYTGRLRPGVQTPKREVPESIARPDYALDGIPKAKSPPMSWIIEVKNEDDIKSMRAAGLVAREVLDLAGKAVKVGATTEDIDRVVHEATVERGAYPSPLNYHGFPKSCCTSVDEIVCHGIPDDTVLQEGMMINVDVTVYYNGYHGDCSEMFMVGEVDQAGKDLIKVTYDAWQEAIAWCKPGQHYKGIGGVVEDYARTRGYTTVRNFCGHGIGKIFHMNPNILHYRNMEPNGVMQPGHTFTIEPMICEGKASNVMWPDQWTAATSDGKRTAQFEHTLLMTEDGAVPLTGKTDSSPRHFWENP